jgi:hypothetical protein
MQLFVKPVHWIDHCLTTRVCLQIIAVPHCYFVRSMQTLRAKAPILATLHGRNLVGSNIPPGNITAVSLIVSQLRSSVFTGYRRSAVRCLACADASDRMAHWSITMCKINQLLVCVALYSCGEPHSSESRLMDIMEKACSSGQRDCHNFVEDAEEKIEEWWRDR